MNTNILFNSPDFNQPKPELEQYSTPVDIVAEIIKLANAQGDLSGSVADLGCGTGTYSIPLALQGIQVLGIDIDTKALKIFNKRVQFYQKHFNKIICQFHNIYSTSG